MSSTRTYKLFQSPPDSRDYLHEPLGAPDVLPTKVDLSPEMPPALQQGTLGACALHATSHCLRHLLQKEGKAQFQPSRLYLYWNTRVSVEHSPVDEDTGVCIRDVCKALSRYHACDETVWPYIIENFNQAPPLEAYENASLHKGIRYAYIPQDLEIMKRSLATGYPFIIGIQVYESLESDAVMNSGVIPMPDVDAEKCMGGHAVLCCGYDDETERFLFLNSWGPVGIGHKGYFSIPYKYLLNPDLAADFWVINFFD